MRLWVRVRGKEWKEGRGMGKWLESDKNNTRVVFKLFVPSNLSYILLFLILCEKEILNANKWK